MCRLGVSGYSSGVFLCILGMLVCDFRYGFRICALWVFCVFLGCGLGVLGYALEVVFGYFGCAGVHFCCLFVLHFWGMFVIAMV